MTTWAGCGPWPQRGQVAHLVALRLSRFFRFFSFFRFFGFSGLLVGPGAGDNSAIWAEERTCSATRSVRNCSTDPAHTRSMI